MTRKLTKLNLGCGKHLVKGFINVDKYRDLEAIKSKNGWYVNSVIENNSDFVNADITNLPFLDNSVDYIECVDTIEHLPFKQVHLAFTEMARVIKPSGKICIETTNFDNLAELWTKYVTNQPISPMIDNLVEMIYGNQQADGEFHQSPFNPQICQYFLENAGLDYEISIFSLGSSDHPPYQTVKWQANATMRSDTLWIEARKPKNKNTRPPKQNILQTIH